MSCSSNLNHPIPKTPNKSQWQSRLFDIGREDLAKTNVGATYILGSAAYPTNACSLHMWYHLKGEATKVSTKLKFLYFLCLIYIYISYTTCKTSSANMGFRSANIQRYYTVQQLIAQLPQRAVKRQLNAAE